MRVASGSGVPESHRDLLDAQFATLATVGLAGRPQVSTVCFLASEDGTVQLSVNATRQKLRNMVENPMVALHILDIDEPFRYLELRGDATVEADDDYAFADQLGAKYGGLDLRDMDQPGEHRTVVTVSVTRVRAVDMRVPGTVGSSLNR
jgi:PPOX class probable F420-dependent enzyme